MRAHRSHHVSARRKSDHPDFMRINPGMKLIAEGIETAEQVVLLQAMDCDLAQGYYFDQPRDVAGVEAFIATHPKFSLAA